MPYIEPELAYTVKVALNAQEKEFMKKVENVIKDSYFIRFQVAYSTLFNKTVTNIDEISNKNDKRIVFCPELSYFADFVLYEKSTEFPVATIEFNGMKHYNKDVWEKDTKKKELCDRANLPYIAFWTQNKEQTVTYPNTEDYIKKD